MKKALKTIKLPKILLAALFATMTIMLPLQAYAYKPSIINQTLPEAVTGSFYCVQLLAEGFGKNAAWRAEGLPEGIEIDPVSGMIFGTAKKPGVFEVIVTVQSGWMWRSRVDSKLFRLCVLPQPAGELPGEPNPDNSGGITTLPPVPPPDADTLAPNFAPEAQTDAENPDVAAVTAIQTADVRWLKLEVNGKKYVETTTELRLEFSQDIRLNGDYLNGEYLGGDYPRGDYFFCIGIKGDAAKITSFSKYIDDNGCTVYLGIDSIDQNLKNGDKIEVHFEAYPESLDYLNSIGVSLDKTSMSVGLNFEVSDSEKVLLAYDELTHESLLGENTNADEITSDLVLPLSSPDYKCDISWQSNDGAYISESGLVTRPTHSDGDKKITLTAAITCGLEAAEKSFIFNIKSLEKDSAEILPEDPTPNPPESLPEIVPDVAPITPNTSVSKSDSGAKATSAPTQTQVSSNVDKSGAVSRTAIINELKTALKDAKGSFAVIKAKNAQSVSPKTLKALAAAAETGGMQTVLHADTVTQGKKVDARLYLKPAELAGIAEPLKLGIATKGAKPEKTKKFFENYFDNKVSVISCEQQGGFGAKLQIAAKVELPEDIGNLVFYSYDANSNTFSRIITAYRLDANGYLRFATEKAGDIVVSNGVLKRQV